MFYGIYSPRRAQWFCGTFGPFNSQSAKWGKHEWAYPFDAYEEAEEVKTDLETIQGVNLDDGVILEIPR